MTVGILGGGIAALSLANFLNDDVVIFEKDPAVGGLCRSFDFYDVPFDVGPHIVFSKNQEVLNFHNSLTEMSTHNRLSKILIGQNLVKYPLENNLYQLNSIDRDKCLIEFQENPYLDMKPANMQQFFLSYFGEGITDLYLYPYNKKIWKLDPTFLDLQMVERIPRPPSEDVIEGAQGNPREGYTHQAIFTYPKKGGFQSLIDSYMDLLSKKNTEIELGFEITRIEKTSHKWLIQSRDKRTKYVDRLVSTIPLPNLGRLTNAPEEVLASSSKALYNSIHIVMLRYNKDVLEDQFGLYVPDPNVIFHRISRLNFLGDGYGGTSGELNLMVEITFRPGSYISKLSDNDLVQRCVFDLEKIGIIESKFFKKSKIRTFSHSYVIYDLGHRERTDSLIDYYNSLGIICHGRFGKFEYQNSDAVVADSMELARQLNKA
jgi:protoporphyrinogen oxidase